MPADPHERDNADHVDDLDGQEAQEEPEQSLPPPGGEGEDRGRKEQRRLDAIAPVFDIDTEAARPNLSADHILSPSAPLFRSHEGPPAEAGVGIAVLRVNR